MKTERIMEINQLLSIMVQRKASDLHLQVPAPPILRVDGELEPIEDTTTLSHQDNQRFFEFVTTQEQKNTFNREMELDFAYSVAGLARFRVNVMRQRGSICINFRQVPFEIPTIDKLGLPQICKEIVMKPRGLVLVTGPTGSGKSTTLAAMIDHLNENAARTIITIEDPIEYLYTNKKCLIAQRDLGDDTKSFSIALKHALRHDPDVILVGEMRDLETISTAISAAETGHLVLATLHTTDAAQTIDRIVDIFPPGQQEQVRLQLSQVIEAVFSQTLLPLMKGKGRTAAFEIMTATTAVRNLIREHRAHDIPNTIQLSTAEGMQTLDQALADLVRKGKVTPDEALIKSSHPDRLKKMFHFVPQH
jgi:twitching motility protein PilT